MSKKTTLYRVDARAGGQIETPIADQIKDLSEAVRTKMLRSIVHAGAEVLYDELKTRAPTGPTGNLKAAIYQFHDNKDSRPGREVYLAGVNKRKAPHWHMVEYGHRYPYKVIFSKGKWKTLKNVPSNDPRAIRGARPYLRPSWDARSRDAIDAMRARAALRFKEFAAGTWPPSS